MPKLRYKQRKDGRYCATITTGKLPNGNFKRKFIYAESVPQLDRKIIELKSNYYKGTISQNENITFKEWAEKWFEFNISTKEHATQQSIRNILNKYLYPNIGYIKLKDLKTFHIKEIMNDMLNKDLKDITKRTVNTVKRILSDAMENDIIYKNVAFNIKVPKFEKIAKKSLTIDEDQLLYNTALTHKYGLFFVLLRYTGIRTEEAVALTKADIDFKNKRIHINKAVNFINNQAVIKATKNLKSRYVPIPEILIDLLKENKNKNYLFTKQTNSNEMLSKIALRRMIDSFLYACDKDKKFKFTCHQLRHSYCSMLYYAGVKIKKAQELMGHSNADMIYNVYTHLDEEKENAEELINGFINNAVQA